MLMDRLIERIIALKSPIVVGLDPKFESLPEDMRNRAIAAHGKTPKACAEAVLEFNKGLIDALCELVPAVKPQSAFYEMLGVEGVRAYDETCRYAMSKGLIVIGDVKRGDIGSTSLAYSKAYLGEISIEGEAFRAFDNDFITINPYLGDDNTREFVADIDAYDKGVFVLVKTSNPSSSQLQNLKVEGKAIYEIVAEQVEGWSGKRVGKHGYSSVGAVVGATYPAEAKILRQIMKTAYFLVPGYGAQGGGGADIVETFDEKGLGAIVNSSRGIIFAYQNKQYSHLNYQDAAVQATLDMRDDINSNLEAVSKKYW